MSYTPKVLTKVKVRIAGVDNFYTASFSSFDKGTFNGHVPSETQKQFNEGVAKLDNLAQYKEFVSGGTYFQILDINHELI